MFSAGRWKLRASIRTIPTRSPRSGSLSRVRIKTYYLIFLLGLVLVLNLSYLHHRYHHHYYVDDLSFGSPVQQPPQPNHDHQEEQQRLILILKGSGLGAQIINTLAVALYFQETQNRTTVILDESAFGEYRRNQTVGFWEGFLTPQSPPFVGVLNNLNKRRTENDERILNQIQQEWLHHSVDYKTLQAQARVTRHQDVASTQNPVVVRTVPHRGYKVRLRIQQHYHLWIAKFLSWMPTQWTGSQELYRKLVDFGCPHLHFNQQTRFEVDQYQRENLGSGNPVLEFGYNNANTTSVAFHIRRGDKIRFGWMARVPFYGGESRFFAADSYVDKMLQVVSQEPSNSNNMPQHCFVASDDYAAVEELRLALQRRNVPCSLHTLTQPTQRGNRMPDDKIAAAAASGSQQREWAKTIHFLAELDLMSRATYFVGTFNSNVASVVALLRGCQCCYDDSTSTFSNNKKAPHFAHSYGVDRDFFYLV